jgi:hypothetical protein
MKILVEHGADVNFHAAFPRSPLMNSAFIKSLPIMEFLLSHGANLFLKFTYDDGYQYETVVGVAYKEYVCAERLKDAESIKCAKKCLDLLVKAISAYLYNEGLKRTDEESFIAHALIELSGHFYNTTNSLALKTFLEENIKPFELAERIRTEKGKAQTIDSHRCHLRPRSKHSRAGSGGDPVGSIPACVGMTAVVRTPKYKFFRNENRYEPAREIVSCALSLAKKQRIK